MKTLSLKQPWAWLCVNGLKDIENRNWRTDYRGPLLIHASKTWDQGGYEFIKEIIKQKIPSHGYYYLGALIGKVKMVDCVERHESKWFFGPWGFVFEDPECWQKPVPYRGQLRLFDVPNRVFQSVPIY